MSSIASGTTTTTALVYTADTTGNLVLQTNGTTTAVTIDTSQNATFAQKITASNTIFSTGGFSGQGAYVQRNGSGGATLGSSLSTGTITFEVNSGTTAMTLDNGGNLYVGTTTQYDGGVINALNTTNNAVVGFRNSYASGGNPVIGYFRLTGQVGSTSNYILIGNTLTTGDTIYIYGNGNIVNKNNSYGTLSDAKLKTNVVLADTQWNDVKALGQVMKKFNFLTDPANSPLQLGWVAQDVQTISPGLVFSSPDRDDEGKTLETTSLGVNTSVAMLKAFKALSEALVRIENLETALTNAKISIPNT